MITPSAMAERAAHLGTQWKDEGGGYFSISGFNGMTTVAYIALPPDHPDVGREYDSFEDGPDVNGGLTYSRLDVFGWDYGHYRNRLDIKGDIKRAIEFFKAREDVTS